jgi:pilus assembly protein CpaE
MDKIRILIADDVEETRNVVKKILNMEEESFQIVGEAGNGEEALKLIPVVKPDVILMDINMPILNGLEATERITDEFPSVIVIIMSVQGENEYLKKAMLHGAKEYIIKPFNYDSLINTVKVTYEKNRERRVKHSVIEEKERNAKIITLFSSKGGVGKSVLAVNTAIALTNSTSKRTLLIDLDLLFGDISMLMNQYTHKNILDVIDEGQLDSYETVKNYLYKYSENLHILFGPRKPEAAEYIGKDSIEKLIEAVKSHYDVIIVDTGVNFDDSTLYVLDKTDTILFVSTMDIVALKNTKLGIGVMQSLGYDKDKVKLVINKFNTDYGINKSDIEAAFKDGVFAVIPEDIKTVNMSINGGKPICNNLKYSKTKIGKAIEAMSCSLTLE